MQQPTTTAPTPSSPASFANLLAALAAPSQKPEEGWNDAELAPDVTTLSYESALRSHARYKGPDRGDQAESPQAQMGQSQMSQSQMSQSQTDQALTQVLSTSAAQSSAQTAVGAAMRARRRALATAQSAQQAVETPAAPVSTGKSGRAKLRSARARAAEAHRTENGRSAKGAPHNQAAMAEVGNLEMQEMEVTEYEMRDETDLRGRGAEYSDLPISHVSAGPVVEALNQPLIDRELRRRELQDEELAEQESWSREQMEAADEEPAGMSPTGYDADAQRERARSAAFERNLKNASVTIRMSRAECEQLHQRAFEAGMTVSAYLRSCTFEAESLRAQVKEALAQMRGNRASRSAATYAEDTEMRSSRRFWLVDVLTFGWLRRMMPQRQSQSVVNA